jgi:hypothetical protein
MISLVEIMGVEVRVIVRGGCLTATMKIDFENSDKRMAIDGLKIYAKL